MRTGDSGMNNKHSVTFNFIMNFILTASAVIFPIITFPYVSRILLPVGTGKVASATAVINYFSMVAMLGIPTYGIRACAQVRDDKEKLSRTVQEILLLNGGMMLLAYLVLGVCIQVVPKFAEDRTILLVMGLTIFLNVIGVNWLYSALEEYAYITMVSLAFKVIGVIMTFLFVHDKQDFVFYGLIIVVSSVGSYVFNFFRLGRYIYLKPMGNYNFKRHMKPIAVFCAMTVANSVYTNLDIVMLKYMGGDEQAGYYTAAVNIKNALMGLVISLGAVLLPRLSYYIEKGMKEEFQRKTSHALSFVLMLALPIAAYFMLFATECIRFISGPAYAPVGVTMRLIMPTMIFIGLSNILGMQILVPTGREQKVLLSVIAGGVVDLLLNLFLIPGMGASGAAIGTLMAEFTVVLVQAIFLKRFLADIHQRGRIAPYLVALIPAMGGSVLLRDLALGSVGDFLTLAATALVFFGLYGGTLLLQRETIVMEFVLPYIRKILSYFSNQK